MSMFEKQPDGSYRVALNREVYSIPAAMKTAYLFTETFYIYLDLENDLLRVNFKPKPSLSPVEAEHQLSEFYNELLHQCIRLQVALQTKGIRELVMGRALYSTVIEMDEETVMKKETGRISEVEPTEESYVWDNQGIGFNFFDCPDKKGT